MVAKTAWSWIPVFRYLLIAVLLATGAGFAESRFQRPELEGEELLYFPNGAFLKEASLGYEQAAAALTWIRVIQYYGGHVRSDNDFRHMFHLCDVITELDPNFEEPYVFGSYVMVTDLDEPEKALALMRKGRENNPGSWRMEFESGIIDYLAYRDRARSAEFFVRAAQFPDSPDYTYRFAAFMSEERGDLEQALVMWRVVAESVKNEIVRQKALEKIKELEVAIAAKKENIRDL